MSWDEPIDAGASMSSAGAACCEDCLLGVPPFAADLADLRRGVRLLS